MTKTGKKEKRRRTIHKTFRNILEHDVAKSAAALTYNLLFALFPLLIFISNLLGLLDLNVASITAALLPILPDDVVYLLESYLNHITDNSSELFRYLRYLGCGDRAAGLALSDFVCSDPWRGVQRGFILWHYGYKLSKISGTKDNRTGDRSFYNDLDCVMQAGYLYLCVTGFLFPVDGPA